MVPDHPASTTDPYNLRRFVEAQHDCYEDVCAELRAGRGTYVGVVNFQIGGKPVIGNTVGDRLKIFLAREN